MSNNHLVRIKTKEGYTFKVLAECYKTVSRKHVLCSNLQVFILQE